MRVLAVSLTTRHGCFFVVDKSIKKMCIHVENTFREVVDYEDTLTNFEGFNRFQGNYQAKKKYLGVKGVCVVFTYPIAII